MQRLRLKIHWKDCIKEACNEIKLFFYLYVSIYLILDLPCKLIHTGIAVALLPKRVVILEN